MNQEKRVNNKKKITHEGQTIDLWAIWYFSHSYGCIWKLWECKKKHAIIGTRNWRM